MAAPIFVVGTPRSGTTWLANMLCRHSRVECVHEVTNDGRKVVNESAFFSYVTGKFGDLKNDNNLIQLIETFEASTFFILSGIDKSILYKSRPRTYHDFFRYLMDQVAEKKGADFWLEKTPSHTFHLFEMARWYPDAKFIIMKRDIVDQIKSFIKLVEIISGINVKDLSFIKKKVTIFVRIFKYYAHCKHLDYFIAKNDSKIYQIEYEDLRESTAGAIQSLCSFVGIDFEEGILNQTYVPNTSFQSNTDRSSVLTPAEIKGIKILGKLIGLLPYRFYRLIYLTKRFLEGRKFPYWFFSYNIEKYGWSNVFGEGHERIKGTSEN